MTSSQVMLLFAKANEKNGYTEYAKLLEATAVVYKANEIIREAEDE